ncbi:hypothetical protein N7495_004900, partial [Penicillium taxi]|uniref:uncharacterized protein n=1 Tax=Penicillium taxi TaxID=168475 RepID=UPI00254501F7
MKLLENIVIAWKEHAIGDENCKFYDYDCIWTDIDRRECRREVSMKILALGMSRTGTDYRKLNVGILKALRQALRILGYDDVYHGYSASLENPRDCKMWLSGLRAKYDGIGKVFGRMEFDQLLGHCQQVVSDFPAVCFSEELIEAYPESRILTNGTGFNIRNRSVNQSIQPLLNSAFLRFIELVDRALLGKTRWIGRTWRKIWKNLFDNNFEQNGRRVYLEHCDLIKNLVSNENLLIFDVRNGWEPLCKFLGHPVPAIDFPKGNTVDIFHRRLASG